MTTTHEMHEALFTAFMNAFLGTFQNRAKVVDSLFGETCRIAEFRETNCQLEFERCPFLNKDLAQVAQCLAPHLAWRLPGGETYTGKENALAFIAERFADPHGPEFSDSRFAFHGDTVIQTYRVQAMGANGKRQSLAGLDVYKVGGGLIAFKDAYWKQLTSGL